MAEYKLKYSGAEIDAKLDEIAEKQDTLTAGDNITITDDGVISATGGGVTIYTLVLPCTAVPIDSTTMIENVYFNTSLSEAEVISLIDNAFASVPDWPMGSAAYVFMSETNDKAIMIMIEEGIYIIQAFNREPEGAEDAMVFISGPGLSEMGAPFTGWNPNFSGELAINEINSFVETMALQQGWLDQFKQFNEALKELISITPF